MSICSSVSLRLVQRGTTLFKVPSTALMNRTTVAKLYPQLHKRKLSATQLISLHLLLHKPSGDDDSSDPAFGPYISTLPREFSSHPLTWVVKQKLKQESDWERRYLSLLPLGSAGRCTQLHKRFWKDWETLLPILVRRLHRVRSHCLTSFNSRTRQLFPSRHDRTFRRHRCASRTTPLWSWTISGLG